MANQRSLIPQLRGGSVGVDSEGYVIFPISPPITYSDATRPDASTLAKGFQIWNTDDKAPQFAGGAGDGNWYDAMGNIT